MVRPTARLLTLVLLQFAVAVLSTFAMVGSAAGMGYERLNTGFCATNGCIVATGAIGAGSAEDFVALLAEWKPAPGTIVMLDSDGGDVVSALKLGGVIRRAGFTTLVGAYRAGEAAVKPATCASACTYVFLGGLQRSLTAGSRIGVHQLFALEASRLSAADAQWLNSLIAVHVGKMGASVGLVVLAMSTPPTTMRWLTGAEVSGLGITTSGAPADMRGTTNLAMRTLEPKAHGRPSDLNTALSLAR